MKTIQKITSIFLCLTFLVSSLGFTANKMVCLKSGRVNLSLVHVKDCCTEKKSTIPVIKSTCCDLTNTTFNLDDFNASQKLKVNQTLFVQSFFETAKNTFRLSSNHKLLISSFTDLPPPLSGRQILSFISILII